MKKIFTFLGVVLLTATLWAQSPEKISYQAVVRDAGNNLVINQSVGMQISILQGATDGSIVYSETQNPTPNANGLVSFEIGAGTVVSGDFFAIDWANGSYFIKTETDPTGGTSYTITGVNQLLSVPYALHAKTAETITGTIPETDPVWYADSSIVRAEVRTEISDSLSTLNAALSTALQDTANQIRADIPTVTTYSVGDFAQGGVVFYVDETGQHGLACAIEDLDGGNGLQWYNGSYTTTSAVGDGIYAGEMNTLLIIANQGATLTNYAAGLCANYSVTQNGVTYGDWYLPSIKELELMYQRETTISATATSNGGSYFIPWDYWSSTEKSNNTYAWAVFFVGGDKYGLGKNGPAGVRAVRAF